MRDEPIEAQRLYHSKVKFRLEGTQPYIELRLNSARPDEARFVMWPSEAEGLGQALINEASKIFPQA